MDAEKISLTSVGEAVKIIDRLGSNNSELMATRAIHINVLIRAVPGATALTLKRAYNELGAEVAISYEAYSEEPDAVTDMLVMGTLYQHREARRVLEHDVGIISALQAVESVIESAPEASL